jgi:hypothetical protein
MKNVLLDRKKGNYEINKDYACLKNAVNCPVALIYEYKTNF